MGKEGTANFGASLLSPSEIARSFFFFAVSNPTFTAMMMKTMLLAKAIITARGALIYKNGGTNPAICVLDFGSDKISTSTFTVTMPADTSTSALIRLV